MDQYTSEEVQHAQTAVIYDSLFCTGVSPQARHRNNIFEFHPLPMGDADAGPVDMKTEILDYDMGQSHHSGRHLNWNPGGYLSGYYPDRPPESEEDIVADDSVPRGIIRFQVTYNKICCRCAPMWNTQRAAMWV